MLYSLLGRIVWHGLKLFLRRKYGSTYMPKRLLAGGGLLMGVGGRPAPPPRPPALPPRAAPARPSPRVARGCAGKHGEPMAESPHPVILAERRARRVPALEVL